MALLITTKPGTTGSELLEKIISDIANEKVKTWSYSVEKGFAHITSSEQWSNGLTLKPSATSTSIQLLATPALGADSPEETYGILHGRFAELIINYYKRLYNNIEIKDTRDDV